MKQHWTQTPEGKARMSQIQSRIQQTRTSAKGTTLQVTTHIVLTINDRELTLSIAEAQELMRLLSAHVPTPNALAEAV